MMTLTHHTTARLAALLLALSISFLSVFATASPGHAYVDPQGGSYTGPTVLTEGASFTNFLGTFFDVGTYTTCPAQNGYSATIDWGDGHQGVGQVYLYGTGPTNEGTQPACEYQVYAGHTFQEEGADIVTVSVRGPDNSTASFAGQVNVLDAPLSAGAPMNLTLTEGQQNNNLLVGTFTDGDVYPHCVYNTTYTASISWGDNTPATSGTISPDPNANGTCLFDVSGNHVYAEEGQYSLSVLVNDRPSSAQLSAQVSVGDATLLTASSNSVSGFEGQALSHQYLGTFNDTANSPYCDINDYTVKIDWGDGSSLDQTSATVSQSTHIRQACMFDVYGSHLYAEENGYQATIHVYDRVATDQIVDPVTILDSPLSQTNVASYAAVEGQAGAMQALGTFHDASTTCASENDPTAQYTASINWGDGNVTAGIVVPSSTGPCNFDVQGAHTYAEEGTYSTSVSIIDEGGATTTLAGQANVHVTDAPLSSTNAGTLSGWEGQYIGVALQGVQASAPVVLGTFTDTDLGCQVSDYALTINWGDGATSTTAGGGISLSKAGCTFTVMAAHLYAEEGTDQVSIQVLDQGGANTTITDTAGVQDLPLSVSSGQQFGGVEGQTFNGQYLGDITDADPGCLLSDYSVSIDWGDGSSASVGTAVKASGCTFHIYGSHTFAEEGTFSVHATVTDSPGTMATVNATANIADAPLTGSGVPQLSGVEGASLNATVATFSDADPGCAASDYAAAIDWGDGNTGTGTIVSTGGCTFAVQGSHAYADETSTPWTVKVTVTDQATTPVKASVSVTDTAVLSDAPLATTHNGFPAVEGAPLTNQVLGTLTDANPNCPASDFTITIDWGDGLGTSSGTVQQQGTTCTFDVLGSHTYHEENPEGYQVAVKISDAGGQKAAIADLARVSDAALVMAGAPVTVQTTADQTVQEGLPFKNVTLGSVNDLADPFCDPTDYTVNINWGDNTANSSGIARHQESTCVFDVQGNHTYAEEGTYTITATMTDSGGKQVTFNNAVIVDDAPLSNVVTNGTFKAVEGASFADQYLGTFTDADPGCLAADYTATVDWGDGSTPSQATVKPTPNPTGPCQFDLFGSHTFLEETPPNGDPFDVKITVTDHAATTVVHSFATVSDAPLSTLANPNWNAVEGNAFTSTYLGTFHDADPGCAATDYTVSVDWGDASVSGNIGGTTAGTVKPAANYPAGSCNFDVFGSYTYAEEGTYTLTATVTDNLAQTTMHDTVTVSDAPLSAAPNGTNLAFTATEGQPLANQVLGIFTDAAGTPFCDINDYTITSVQWGDGSTDASQAKVVQPNPATCTFQVVGSHTFTEESEPSAPDAVSITVLDTSGSLVTITDSATVTDAPLVAPPNYTPPSYTVLYGQSGTNVCTLLTPCTKTLGTFVDTATLCMSENESLADHYLISIDWGDGSPLDTASGSLDEHGTSCTFDVAGTHIYTTPDTFKVSVYIRDEADDSTPPVQLVLSSATDTGVTIGVGYPASNPARTNRSLINVGYAYPAGVRNPLYAVSATVLGKNPIVHLSVNDRPDVLQTGICDSRYSYTFQCKASLLSDVCVQTGTAKYATLWEMYQWTDKASKQLLTRYIKLEFWDPDPSVNDDYKVTMSTQANPAVAGTTVPATQPYRAVTVVC